MAVQKTVNRDLLFIAILSVVTVAAWIGLTVYLALRTPTTTKVLQEQLQPINPDFDTQVINALNLRETINQQDLDRLQPRALSLVEEGEKTSREATPSAPFLKTSEASPSAGLTQE